ncbi:MAG TPA: Holliday junction resolvase RuvX [Chitinophagales bacterium]|nr:Holliday junction resolvase RuvX [Chitinophagales bacterium]
MAFDFGGKRTGVAVTDPLQIIATSLETVETNSIYDYIAKYLKTENVERFVVGYPRDLMNRDQTITKHVNTFIEQLEKRFNLPVSKVDERFTSLEAQRTLVNSGMKKQQRREKGHLDKISATIILQAYLQTK